MSAATDRIANMVVGVSADPTELKSGLREAGRYTDQFVQQINVSADRMRDFLKQAGGDLQKAARLAVAATQSDMGKVVPISSAAGYQAGKAMGESMMRGFGASNAAANIRRALGAGGAGGVDGGGEGLFPGSLGSRGRAAFITGAFTLAGLGDAFADGESKLTRFTQGLNQVLRSASVVAAFFGPTGLLASAVLAGTSFVLDFFAKTKDAADKMALETEKRIRTLINAGNQRAQLERLQQIDEGELANAPSRFAAGARAGGVLDLRPQLQAQEQALRTANFANVNLIKRNIAELRAQLDPLLIERARVIAAIMNPRLETTGPKPIVSTAPAPGHEFDQLQRSAQKALTLYHAVADASGETAAIAQRLVDTYFRLGRALDTIGNPWDDQAISVSKLRAEIEKTLPILERLTGMIPGVSQIGERRRPGFGPDQVPFSQVNPKPAAGADATPKFNAIERVLTNALGAQLGLGIAHAVEDVGKALKSVAATTFSPVALLMRALEPGLRVLGPLLDKLAAPIAAVVQIIAASLEPVLRLLFPILRAFGIVVAFVSEVAQRAAALLARVIGNVVVAIGKLLQRLSLGFAGKGLERLGNSFLSFADGAKNSADEMARIRKELYGMRFGDTAESITGLGDAARSTTDALLNVPYGFRIALERYAATIPGGPRSAPSPSGSNGGSTGGVPVGGGTPTEGRIVIQSLVINSQARDAEELFRDVAQVARQKAQQQYGTTARAADTFARGR